MWFYALRLPAYLAATSLPLATSFGANLEYEYSLIATWLTILLVPIVALATPRQYLPQAHGSPKMAAEMVWLLFPAPCIALLPPVMAFWLGLCPCSSNGFGFWMLVQWLPGWFVAHGLYHVFIRLRVSNGPYTKHLNGKLLALGFAVLVTFLFFALARELWVHPQKRTVDLVAGFLHGPIYDTFLPLDGGIVLARAAHAFVGLGLIFLAWVPRQVSYSVSAGVFLAGWFILGGLALRFPSVHNGQDHLDRLLAGKINGPGFVLHYYRKAKPQEANEEQQRSQLPLKIRRLYRDTEFHIQDLTKVLALKQAPTVHVYVYPNSEVKKLWFGGGSTDVADVYTPSIHITDDRWPHPTLRHELVHAITRDIAFHGLGFHPNMAFTEGLAVALAPIGRDLDLHSGAAALLESNRLPPVENLLSPAFWRESGRRAYTVAGSIIQYLIQEHGIEPVKKLYGGMSWDEAIGKDRAAVLNQWRAFVLENFDRERHALFAEQLYRHPGVIRDLCPHTKADYRKSRSQNVWVRLRQPIGWDPAEDYNPWRLRLEPDNQQIRLNIWRKAIADAAKQRFTPLGRLKTWQTTLSQARTWPPKTVEDVEMALLESDITRLLANRDRSLNILQDIAKAGQSTYFGAGMQRAVTARLRIEDYFGETAALPWRQYLAGWARKLPDQNVDEPWLVTYLRLRNDSRSRLRETDLLQLHETAIPDTSLPTVFVYEWHRILGVRLHRVGAYEEAAESFERAAGLADPAKKELMLEHAARARFYAAGNGVRIEAKRIIF